MGNGENPRYGRAKIAAAVRSRLDTGMPTHSREPLPNRDALRAAEREMLRRYLAGRSPEQRQADLDHLTSNRAEELFKQLTLEQQLGALAAVSIVLERVIDTVDSTPEMIEKFEKGLGD